MLRKLDVIVGHSLLVLVLAAVGCDGAPASSPPDGGGLPSDAAGIPGPDTGPLSGDGSVDGGTVAGALPLVLVGDIDLPGNASRFDYQDVDRGKGHMVATHLADGSIVILDLATGAVIKEVKDLPTARGVAVADDIGVIFVTISPDQLALVDNSTYEIIKKVPTGSAPDGVAWDPDHQKVGVSDQRDGALSIIANGGNGDRTQVPVGVETGNVIYDAQRQWFWITAVQDGSPDRLVAVDPMTAQVKKSIDLPGCQGAHGLRLHPDGQSAFIACESNDVLARAQLEGDPAVATASTGAGPDVMAIDPALGWLYVAAESGDLTVFDIRQPGVVLVGHDHPGGNAHSVAVDLPTHRVFFPLESGPNGTPVMRIMKPTF
jgi:DNA-binding beta-propeller fold protein YncE